MATQQPEFLEYDASTGKYRMRFRDGREQMLEEDDVRALQKQFAQIRSPEEYVHKAGYADRTRHDGESIEADKGHRVVRSPGTSDPEWENTRRSAMYENPRGPAAREQNAKFYSEQPPEVLEIEVPGLDGETDRVIRVARRPEMSDQDWGEYQGMAVKRADEHGRRSGYVKPRGEPTPDRDLSAVAVARGKGLGNPWPSPIQDEVDSVQDSGEGGGGGGGGGWMGALRRAALGTVTNAAPQPAKSGGWLSEVQAQQDAENAELAKTEPAIGLGPALDPAPTPEQLAGAEQVFQRRGIPKKAPGVPGYTPEDVEILAKRGGREFSPNSGLDGPQREQLIDAVAPGESMQRPEVLKAERAAAAPADVVMPVFPGAPPGASMAGFNFSASMPGASPAGPSTGPAERQIAAGYDRGAQALAAQADLEGKRLDETAKLVQKGIDHSTAAQKRIQQTAEMRQSAVEDLRRGYEKTVSMMHDPSMTVDPHRFWNNRSTGQKVLAGVSILLGGLGQGTFAALGIKSENNALEIILDAVRRDVEVQGQNIETKRGMVKDLAVGQRELFNMLRQEGMDEIESLRLEEAAKLDIVQRQIEQLAAQMGSAEAKARAQAAIGAIEVEKGKVIFQARQHRDSFALSKAELETKRFSIGARMAAGGGRPASPAMIKQSEELAEIQARHQEISGLQKQFGSVAGFFQKVPGGAGIPKTAAKEYNDAAKPIMRKTAIAIDKSVLQKHDIDQWEAWWPRAGDTNGEAKLRQIEAMLRETHNLRLRALQQVGADTGALQPINGGYDAGANYGVDGYEDQ